MKENNTYNNELGGKNLPDSLRVNPFLIPTNFFEEQESRIISQIRMEKLIGEVNETDEQNATLPSRYFENLTDSIFAKIAEQNLKDKILEDGFAVPNQYFDQLAQNTETNILEEKLKSNVPMLEFRVPENYFSTAEEQIFAKLAESKLRSQIGEEAGFTVPDQYFEQMQTGIEAHILTEKWGAEIGKEQFTVPEGYFDELSANILAKTTNKTKQETTIINLPKRMNWKKYSAAAAIVLLAGVGSYFGFQNNNPSSNQLAKTEINLENVSDEEIISYLAQISEGEDLIQLAEFASDNNEENALLDPDIESKEIEEYLNYML